jgi:hypothetical protein
LIAVAGAIDAAGSKLVLRIGIATGLAVVGDLIGAGAAQEESVIGETPNLAAWLPSPRRTRHDPYSRRHQASHWRITLRLLAAV